MKIRHAGSLPKRPSQHKVRTTLSWSLALGLVSWACTPSSAQAATTKPSVLIKLDEACANTSTQQRFVKELKVRLPEGTTYLSKAPEADQAHWRLIWDRAPNAQCRVSLTDTNVVMALPLVANAEPPAIQGVLVRMVWFISTSSPRVEEKPKQAQVTTTPEQPKEDASQENKGEENTAKENTTKDETAKTDTTTPETTPKETDQADKPDEALANKDPDPPSEIERPDPMTRTPAKTNNAPVGVLDQLTQVLVDFRTSTPSLFGEINPQSRGMSTTLFGSRTNVAFHAALSGQTTIIKNSAAWLAGVHVGALFGRKLNLGISYQMLANPITMNLETNIYKDSDKEQVDRREVLTHELRFHTLLIEGEYLFFPNNRYHVGLGGFFGPATSYASAQDDVAGRYVKDSKTNYMLAVGVNANLYYDLFSWMQVGVGFTWRDVYGESPGEGTIMGPSGNFILRIGYF